jgi:uncharacterized protein YndB with AHSA1/START domain
MSEAVAAVVVDVAPDRAFDVFTAELGAWWPREFTWSQERLESIGLDGREGGLCTECGPYGFRIDWGRVLEWDPPRHLALCWQISPARAPEPDPDRASRVDVEFAERRPGVTEVRVIHSGFERHGDGADAYREAMRGEGWPHILGCFAERLSLRGRRDAS